MNLPAHALYHRAALAAEEPVLLHHFFDNTLQRFPDRYAVDVPPGVGREKRRLVTYAELDQQANLLASLLLPSVFSESVVTILLPRRSEMLYSSQLAVLRVGAAYACIDPVFPDEQIADILNDADAQAVLTDKDGLERLEKIGFDRQRVFDVAEEITRNGDEFVEPPPHPEWLTPQSLAYIIYTSGTTGRPKGVMIEHAGIANLVGSGMEALHLSANDRIGQSSSPAYDSSVEEIWLAFSVGATLVVIDDETIRSGPDLVPWLRDERLTAFIPPPTLLRTTGCEDPHKELPDLTFVYVGGEALPTDVAERWGRGLRLVNGYGPTECTVTATRTRIELGEEITIGWPVRGMKAWVLNEALEEVPDGERGELCMGGIGLARGYRNRPELTAKKFPTHPKFGRIYHTGDLVHRLPDGSFVYHGRIDTQVKLRGYRIELEAVEARLSECEGVREAACTVQGEGAQQTLVVFIVPDNPNQVPSFDDLKSSLQKVLPSYMVPSHFGVLADLPTQVSGKLDRKALPLLEREVQGEEKPVIAPRNLAEQQLETAFRKVFKRQNPISIEADFFNDLGGDSLSAAILISLLRDDPATASLTVRDLYETRTITELAKRVRADEAVESLTEATPQVLDGSPFFATVVQLLWLLVGLVLGAALSYFIAFTLLPRLIEVVGLIPFLLLSPLFFFVGLALYTPLSVLTVGLTKKILIGRYRALREPVWGSFYVRHWMVQQTTRLIPWRLLEGTVFQSSVLRLLGARIGERVHIHRGVNLLQGGWDLLHIGDDVTLCQDASLRLVDFEDGHIVIGPISLGEGCTLNTRSGVGNHTVMKPESYLTALSSLGNGGRIPRGERWDGVPAGAAGLAPKPPQVTKAEASLSPVAHGVALILARFGLAMALALIIELPTILYAQVCGVDAESALQWLAHPSLNLSLFIAALLMATLPVPLMIMLEAMAARALGRVRPGIISLWSLAYVRVCLKTELLNSASDWLSGTLFWPHWLRLAGMKIGRDCEISTIIDVVPELITIDQETFFADGIYLAGPRLHRGTVTLEETRLSPHTFLGNHAVIPMGQNLPNDILIGVSSVSDDTRIRPSSSWFGHPLFELPRREVIEVDRRLTHNPTLIRYLNRLLWELLRFALPAIPALVLPVWYELLAMAAAKYSAPVFLFAMVPLISFGVAAFFCLLVIVAKWTLLGRVRPGQHPLWSCWCCRWDFVYVMWAFYARATLTLLEGTLLLSWYLRAMGMQIGRRVVLGGGFAHVVDPDMLHFEDGATVSCQFQAHTFEDRVLKIDHVWIRRRATVGSHAVLLYGADIGAGAKVAPHSVVMKRESLLPGRSYAGCPTRPLQ